MPPTETALPLVVVVAYQSDGYLPTCLSELDGKFSVIVVDNSAAETTESIALAAGAKYVAAPTNLGFACAVNLALRTSWNGTDDVLLLNPDARIAADGVHTLQESLHSTDKLAAVGPRLIGDDGQPQRADWPMPTPGQLWLEAIGAGRVWSGRRFVVGAVLMLNGAALAELGGMDERYFLYAEEADWQMRAHRAGWDVAVVDAVLAHHVGSASSSDPELRDRIFQTSQVAFARKWYGPVGRAAIRSGRCVAAARRALIGVAEARQAGRRALRLQRPGARLIGASDEVTKSHRRGHVVHVVRSDAYAGVEIYIVGIATELHRRGWQVTVIGGNRQRMLEALPQTVRHLPGATLTEVAHQLWAVGRVQVIHAHMTAAEVPAALLKRQARLIVTRHFASRRGRTRLGRASRPFLRHRIDRQIAISQFVADHVDGESVMIHNAVSDGTARTGKRGKTVLVLQRLEQEKDTALAIRAWAISRLADDGWRLIIRGRGAQEAALRQLAADEGVAASVDFPGFTTDPRGALGEATLLLATAPAEPFGLSVVEAMAEGTVVVAADGGAHRETLGDAGVYFRPGDPASCAEALRLVTGDATRQRRMAAAGKARQRDEFRIDQHADRVEQVYFG